MQLTRTRNIIGGLALAGTMALSGIVGFAQQGTQDGGKDRGAWGRGEGGGDHKRGGRGMRGGLGRFAENLNLTDAQKAQMEQITARYRETAKAGRQQRGQERGMRGGFDPFNGGTFNEAEVRAAAQARANAQVEREVRHARMMSEMYAVLTAEQKAQLAAERQQREQRRQERRQRRNADIAIPTSRT